MTQEERAEERKVGIRKAEIVQKKESKRGKLTTMVENDNWAR